jgi:rhodanese-related sulfurtransferase
MNRPIFCTFFGAIVVGTVLTLNGCATAPPQSTTPCATDAQTLWRGARPDALAATALVEAGVRTVVNLELLLDDKAAFLAATPTKTNAEPIQYFRVRDWEPLVALAPSLTDDHVAHFIAITRTQAKPIYVHCRSGQNRTGVMVAAYKIFNGADIETTIAEMAAYGGFWANQDSEYLRRLTPAQRMAMEANIGKWVAKLKPDAQIVCDKGKCNAS